MPPLRSRTVTHGTGRANLIDTRAAARDITLIAHRTSEPGSA